MTLEPVTLKAFSEQLSEMLVNTKPLTVYLELRFDIGIEM